MSSSAHGLEENLDAELDAELDAKLDAKLIDACKRQRLHKVAALVAQGANPHAKTKTGIELTHWAAAAGKVGVVEALLDVGANVRHKTCEKKNIEGDPAGAQMLHFSARNAHLGTCELLLGRDADPSATDNQGNTALHFCAYRQNDATKKEALLATASLLIRAGANVNAQTKSGFTPLAIAAYYGRTEMFGLLLKNGADSSIPAFGGRKTVLEVIDSGDIKFIGQMRSLVAASNAMRAIENALLAARDQGPL